MTKEVRDFFKKIRTEKPNDYFLFNRFYYNPSYVLGGENTNIEDYIKFEGVNNLILNKDFIDLLYLCTCDDEFILKLNYNIFKKIQLILIDSLDIIDFNLNEVKNDPNFKWVNGIKDLDKKIEETDYEKLRETYYSYSEYLDIAYNNEIKPGLDEEILLNKSTNVSYLINFLNSKNGQDKESFYLVCNNRFLDIVSNILGEDLPRNVIDNIINILQIGINICSNNGNYYYKIYKQKKEAAKTFDYVKAEFLISKLNEKKRDIKVINLSDYIARKNSFE